ncbi:MAG TPA: glycosyltransferase [Fimbriimonadaceae bacterium]|nr:glycosyltransferase [Fimbriimonadaceae bacterium]
MPRVSILLTCYNHLEHLKVAMDCIRAQTYKDYDIIALDDGSTDGTREWLTELKHNEPDLPLKLFFNDENLGTYGTLNKGIDVSTGELIAEFNDDDVWAPTKLEKQVAMMDSDPRIGLVHTAGYFIDGEGNELRVNPLGFEWPKTGTGDVLLELIPYNKIIASSVLVRRDCFDKVGKFNTEYFGSGDWEMWYRIAEQYHVGHIDEPLTLYRVHAGSASHFKDKVADDDRRIREWMLPRMSTYFDRGWDNAALRRMIAHQWACIGSMRVWTGSPREGRQAYVESLKVMPWRFKSVLRYFASFLPNKVFKSLN